MVPENEKNYYSKHQHLMWFLIPVLLIVFAGVILVFNKNRQFPQAARLPASLETAKQGRIYTVFYTSGVFSPTNIQINLGDTVRFRNDSFFGIRVVSNPHPQHSDLPGLDSITDIPQNGIFSYTFTQRGIFDYHNEKNPQQDGTVIVK